MLDFIKDAKKFSRKILINISPYDGFRNRTLIKSYSGFERNFYEKYWYNVVNNITAKISDAGYGYFKIEKNNVNTYVKNNNVMLDNHVTLRLAGNKPFILHELQEQSIPVPRHLSFEVDELDKAYEFLDSADCKVVIKPACGTGSGRGVTTGIDTHKKLKKASFVASSYCNKVLIEEQVQGDSYRLLYINGEFIDAIRRDPPMVIGDGINTIKTLVDKENFKRLHSDEILSFNPLIIDLESKLKLKEQGLDVKSIPEVNRKVIIKTVVNQNNCFQNHIVRDSVDLSTISLGRKVINELGIKLGGIDVIAQDISKPLNNSNGVIDEINTTPGLHHHVLVAEKDKIKPIGELVLDYIFSK